MVITLRTCLYLHAFISLPRIQFSPECCLFLPDPTGIFPSILGMYLQAPNKKPKLTQLGSFIKISQAEIDLVLYPNVYRHYNSFFLHIHDIM